MDTFFISHTHRIEIKVMKIRVEDQKINCDYKMLTAKIILKDDLYGRQKVTWMAKKINKNIILYEKLFNLDADWNVVWKLKNQSFKFEWIVCAIEFYSIFLMKFESVEWDIK